MTYSLPSISIPWPRLCREVCGALVELRRDIRTRGGEVFKAGERLTVHHAHGTWMNLGDGRWLSLRPHPKGGWSRRIIHHVERRDVRLVALSGGKPPRRRGWASE